MKRLLRLIACIPALMASEVFSQQMLNLQESPPSSGLFTAQVTDSYTSTGAASGKQWGFNAAANDRVSFHVRTTAVSNSYPIVRVASAGGTTLAEVTGASDGFVSLENVLISTPGAYQVLVYSNNSASAFSMNAILGRAISLEYEYNDQSTQANAPAAYPQAGGFRAVTAGVLDRNPDWSDLGTLTAGDSINLSLQTPAGSPLAASGVELALFKDAETTPTATATGTSLIHTVASAGRYRVRLQMPDLDGRYLTFNGGQSLSLGNPAALQITGSQTIEFWIKPKDFNSNQSVYAKAYGGEGSMALLSSGTIDYYYGTTGANSSPYQAFNTGARLRTDRWQHLALVRDFDSSPKQLRWYLDGKLVAQAEASYFPAVASSLPATVADGWTGSYRGSMDELRIWNVARTGTEIADNLDNSLTGSESGLVAYYRLSEGSGTTTADATASAITATINGSPSWDGTPSATVAAYASQNHNATYLLTATVGDTSAPTVSSMTPIPPRGHLLEGTTYAPTNVNHLRGNNDQSYLYTLTGETGGSIWGTDTYTDDSYLAKAAVHAGVLRPGETGAVKVTIKPGASGYLGTTRFGVGSAGYGGYYGSYIIERHTPVSPFALNGLYASFSVAFSEPLDTATLASGVTLVAAGTDGSFGTADDISYPLAFSEFTWDNRAIINTANGAILAPGAHRLTVPTTVTDRAGNPLASPHVENFTVLGVAGYANEQGDNGSQTLADMVSSSPSTSQPDGSFSDAGRVVSTAGWPHDIDLADLDGDGKLDAAVTQMGSVDGLRVFPGNGDRTFGTPVQFNGIGDEPHYLQFIDWDKDGDKDIAVVLTGPDLIALFRNDSTSGNIAFTRLTDVAVGDYPLGITTGDFNGDTWPDLAVSNHGTNGTTGYSVSILINDHSGSFTESKIGLTLSPRIRPFAINAADLNGDGKADLAVGDIDNGDRIAIFSGVGDGTFGAPAFLDTPDGANLSNLPVADFNGDGFPDIAAVGHSNGTYDYWVFPGAAAGTFGTRLDFDLSYGYHTYAKVADFNADGYPDLLLSGNDHVTIATNRADGTIGFNTIRRNWYETYRTAIGDLNGDGPPEIVIADHDESCLRILDGNFRAPLAADDPTTNLRHGFGRGFLSTTSDVDYWSFTASRGQVLTVAVDHAAQPGNPGLSWNVYDEVGNNLTSFLNGASGWRGQTPPYTIPRDGTYYLRVSDWYGYQGEYRFRITLSPPSTQTETEDNNAINQSDPVAFTLSGNTLSGTIAGYVAGYDTNGDFFNLGNLASGTQITANLRLPTTSTLTPVLTLFKADGSTVTPTTLTPTQLVYTLQPGDESTYHIRVTDSAGRGIMAEYFLDLELADVVPPSIVSNSLPAEGSTVTYVASSFSLGFSEDMLASAVTNAANYELLASGGDGIFGNGNDVAYTIVPPAYTSGLSATYSLPVGPLQADLYRFTATTSLKDKLNNNLTESHVRTFTVAGVPGWVLEDRDNNSQATADTLSLAVVANQPDGSFSDGGRTAATGGWPFDVEIADLDGDGNQDAAVTHLGSLDSLRIYRGDGSGNLTFSNPFPAGTGLQPMTGDYYDNSDFTGTLLTRTDATVDFSWGGGSPDPSMGADTFSVRWTGAFIPPTTGSFLLHTVSDDGVRLWVDLDRDGNFAAEELLIDRWFDQGGVHYQTTPLALTSGLSYPVKMEYYENGGGATARLYASSAMESLGDEPYDAQLIDLDKDGDQDIAVTVYGSDIVAVFRNDSSPGSIAFTRLADIAVGDQPHRLAVADFNGDTWPDLICSNRGTDGTSGYCVSVMLNNQTSGFAESKVGLSLSPKIRPWGIAAGDFNKDNKADIAVTDQDNGDRIAIFLGAGDGTFGAPTFLDTPDGPNLSDLEVADFNQDGNPDLAGVAHDNGQYDYWVFPGNGNGTFGTRLDFDLSYGYYNHFFKATDINGDGYPDLLMAGNDHVTVATNRGGATIGFDTVRRNWYETYGVTTGDLNNDGRPDLVIADHDENLLRILDATSRSPLTGDDTSTGIVHGYGRGMLTTPSDIDYWSFTATRGQVLTIAVDHSEFPNNPGLNWYVYNETGSQLTYFYNGVSGWRGQTPPLIIPRDGTYYLRVSNWYDYLGEYRFRVSLAPPGSQIESEDNNAVSQSDPLTFALSGNTLSATAGGYIAGYDTSGDYFNLGNLAPGAQLTANLRLPSTSTLSPVLTLFKADGSQVTPDSVSPTQLVHTIPAGDGTTYHLRVTDSAGRGLMAEYLVDLSISDAVPPTVVSNTLPAEGSSVSFFGSGFSLGFSEDMLASSVNAPTNYQLIGSGGDGTFSDGNEIPYALAISNYTGGLGASFTLTDGPMQPDTYRFTASTALKDRNDNPLAEAHVRTFTITAVPGWVHEDRSNDNLATADSISTSVASLPDGSFSDFGRTTSIGGWPYDVELADLDGDGDLDAAVTHLGSIDGLRIYPGNGNRTFGASLNFDNVGNEPYDALLIDWDKDGDQDISVTIYGNDVVALFRNDSTPGNLAFTRMPDVSVGDEPHRMATGDFNGDGWPDLSCSNRGTNGTTGYSVSILLNDQTGGFTESKLGTSLSPRVRPWGLTTGDYNKDGKTDIAAGDIDNGDRIAIFLGVGDGTFGAPSFLDTPDGPNPCDLETADFNQDGNPDIAVSGHSNGVYDYWIFPGNGDGSFGTRADFDLSYGYYGDFMRVADVNGDSWPDLVLAGNDHVTVATNRADGVIGFNHVRRNWYETYGTAVGDLNGDGRPELVVADHDESLLRVLDGNARSMLALDDTATDLRHGYGRGFLSSGADVDFWSFTASRGEILTIAVDNSAFPGNPGLNWYVYDEVGNQLAYFYNGQSGWRGQTPPYTIPRSGTYYLRASEWYGYSGEYRFRATLAPPGTQVESEDNNAISQSDPVSFTLSGSSLSATTAGYVAGYDTSGDYFNLGNLAAGTQVAATLRIPSTSTLAPVLTLFKADGTAVTPTTLTPTQLVYTLQPGDESTYHIRVTDSAGRGLMAEYFLDLIIADTVPPAVTACTLPTGTSGGLVSSFSLSFNKDMLATTVNNAANYALVWSGPDGTFSTADDAVIALTPGTYSSGLSNAYAINNAPLLPGNYRFTVSTGLRDKFGNNLPLPYETTFTIGQTPGYVTETEPNNGTTTSTPIVFNTDIAGYLTANCRGILTSDADIEYWTFDAEAGDKLAFEVFFPYEPSNYALNWYLTDPDGAVVFNRNLASNSIESNAPVTLAKTGAYRLRIDDYHGIRTEYRFRVSLMRGLLPESEQNDSLGAANTMTFAQVGGIDTASVAGLVGTTGELDYFNLGTISAGNTVFLTVRRPAGSTLGPIVSLYSQSGTLMAETNGTAGDDSAEVQIPTGGTYYALVWGSLGTTGLNGDYILDARVLPTTAVNFPNLRVTRLDDIVASNLKTGDTINLSYDVTNVGNLATASGLWVDRVVISPNAVYGDADDIQLALITHNGTLAPSASYTVNQTLTLTDGLPGSYYLLVKTDSSNSVDEILQEGDNATSTANPFNVALRDYPDLVIEDFTISAPNESGLRTISWNLANRGTGAAAAGHTTRLQALNTTTSQVVTDLTLTVSNPLAPNESVAQSQEITTTAAGYYLVTAAADSANALYEYGVAGHAVAEQNTIQSNFQIYRYYDITVAASPAEGGSVTGTGSAREGLPVTVTATPNTSVLPYVFLNWTEGGSFVSSQANYTFVPTRNRSLVAVFGLPQFQIAAAVSPPGTGSVSGTGNFALNTPISLGANPAPGYLFDHWEENSSSLGTVTPLVFTATANRNVTAFFRESVPSHVVSVATQPSGLTTISGAGTYNNGQSVTITAPARIEQGDSEYLFQRFELNGQFLGSAASFNKTFSTLDAATLNYTAVYQERSLKPVVSAIVCSRGTLVPIASDVTFTVTFDRDMNQAIPPAFALASVNATEIPAVPAGGTWLDARRYRSANVAFGATNGGAYTLRVTAASDSLGHVMDANETFGFTMDSLAPTAPVLVVSATSPNSATVSWTGYTAPVDLSGFRYYLEDTDFTAVSGLSAKGGGNAAARSTVFNNLLPDHEYFAAVTAVDVAGNASNTVTTVRIFLESQVPPPVVPLLTTTGLDAARLDWNAYDTSSLVGLAGFKVYSSITEFTDVTGLTPVATLPATTKTHDLTGLDRTQTHYLAVVGYNGLGQLNPAVTPVVWSDPLSGTLRTNLTIGGASAIIPIHADLAIDDGAVLTLSPGTTLRFADGVGLEVLNGRIVANGTDLLPIHFTSQADDGAGTPARGAWNGVTLSSASGVSELSRVWIRYGSGLNITAGSPNVTRIYAVQNAGAGIAATGSAQINATDCYLAFNDNGVSAADSASVAIHQSVIQNNSTANAAQAGTATFDLASNWWGTPSAAAIAATLTGSATAPTPLTGEPVIGSALVSATGNTDTGSRNVDLRLMAVNAIKYRASENSAFTGASFTDLFDPDESFRIRPYGFTLPFTLSTGAGLKTVYLQTNSATATNGPTHSVAFNYITGGPVVASFSLTDGQTVSRPITVTGSATAPLGVKWIDFLIDGNLAARNSSTSFNMQWDPRSLAGGIHRVELRARDQAGNESGRALNITIAPAPPPAPVVSAPADGSVTNTAATTVSGTAEPGVSLRITRNGATVSGTLNAAPNGTFSVSGIPLVEGDNTLVVTAFDNLGSASSTPRTVIFDTGPPAAPVLGVPVYQANRGLDFEWQYAETGERPAKFKLFWHNAAFTTTGQATGQSAFLTLTSYNLSSLPDGTWYFSVVGYDDAGNPSALSNQRSMTVDFQKPAFSVAYDGSIPAGPGNLGITLTSNEPLSSTPIFTIRPAGSPESVSVPLTQQSPTIFTANFLVTDLSAASGAATVRVSATDLANNSFTGSPSGPALAFDVTKPTGALTLDRSAPIQTIAPVTVNLGLQLSEPPAVGSTPVLRFEPPVGSDVTISLTGSGTTWTGSLGLTPAMGRGTGFFRLAVTDRYGNSGTVLTPGSIEIYNTEFPDPPARPTGLSGQALSGGRVSINWDDVPRAESYRIYREPGNNAAVPTLLLADNVTDSEYTDTPPADGYYTYAVVAVLRGAESQPSGVLNAPSDRTPPEKPENFTATLGNSGVAISWSAPTGEVPQRYKVYRGDTVIYTTTTPITITDHPPRGIHEYRVASADPRGNENSTDPITIELLVSPVNNLQALLREGSPTSLTWQSTDPTVTGFNIYRNGVKQNGASLPNPFHIDPLPTGTTSVVYEVTALNAAGNESPRRSLTAMAAALNLLLNPDATNTERPSIRYYFDTLRPTVTNLASGANLAIERFDIMRTVGATDALETGADTNLNIAPGQTGHSDFVVPAPRTAATPQTIQLLARGPADESGGRVTYEAVFTKSPAVPQSETASLVPAVPPLAGGLTDFTATIFNPSAVPIEIIIGRATGNQPGDVSVAVLDPLGVEVHRKLFNGAGVSPVTTDGSGNMFLTIPPRGSKSFTIPDVFVPEALGEGNRSATFVLHIAAIHYRTGTGALVSAGNIANQISSSLVQTPYYGTSETNKNAYADNEPIIITGQAIDRATSQPLPNTALHIGFGARGTVIYQDVTTDGSGNYTLSYTPTPGFAGRLNIWAAHPDVVDQLNQVSIEYRRLYVTPGRGQVVMSKNDTLDISMRLFNPGDIPVSDVTLTARAYVMDGENEVPVPSITAALIGNGFDMDPKQERAVGVRLTAALDAPDNALIDIGYVSADGATATFYGTLSLRPAVPALSFVKPRVGYLEGSVNRGSIQSYEVILENLGLRAVENPEVILPSQLAWVDVNLQRSADGRILLPDIPIGGRISFAVSFAPPESVPLGFYNDFFEVRATNLQTPFRVNVFPQVTSSQVGEVKFKVDNIFVDPVPNAKVRLRNPNLREELGPFLTDSNGEVTIPNLQEGTWSWQIIAAGHSSQTGTVEVIPGQITLVETRLSKSLVTVEFSVVPKPFTDRYEIVIEQTFETRVPFPVLVFDPPSFQFTNPDDQFETTLLVKARNEGLISMFDLEINGEVSSYGSLQPLIDYLPELHAQEEVLIPFRMVWNRNGLGSEGSGPVESAGLGKKLNGCVEQVFGPPVDKDFLNGLAAIGNAIAQCIDGFNAKLFSQVVVGILFIKWGKDLLDPVGKLVEYIGCVIGSYIASDPGTPSGYGGPGGGGGLFSGRGCFPAGTPVTLADGSRIPIEKVHRDQALRTSTWRGHSGTVDDLITRQSAELHELVLRELRPGSVPVSKQDLTLRITAPHLVWNDASGWIAASALKPGDWVHHESGALLEVVSNTRLPGTHTVYTIEVKGTNAFFASGLMVQDLCGAQKLKDRSALETATPTTSAR
ncbi:MAG: VCBS repeat-containing protein [Verrucomicrobia bacterium]|nr:VCBS repeat-containing protein [Verrucomicrobiota bacterium]